MSEEALTTPGIARRRRWLWTLASVLLLALCGAVLVLNLILLPQEGPLHLDSQTNWVLVVGLAGMVLIFVLYASRDHQLLSAKEVRIQQLGAREVALRERMAELAALFNATTELAMKPGLSEMLQLAVKRTRSCLEADSSSVVLFDPATRLLAIEATAGLTPSQIGPVTVRPGHGIVGLVYTTGEGVVVDSEPMVTTLTEDLRLGQKITSGVCVPLRFQNTPIGVFTVCRVGAGPAYGPTQAKALSAFAEHFAATVVKTYHYERLIHGGEKALRGGEAQVPPTPRIDPGAPPSAGSASEFDRLLSVIEGHTRLLSRSLREGDPMRARVEEIAEAARQAAALTQQVLYCAGSDVKQPESLDLNRVVAGFEEALRQAAGPNIEMVFVPGNDLRTVMADPGQMQLALMNLVVNAREAMSQGGRLTLETTNVDCDEDFARRHGLQFHGAHVMLSVTDSGCGMDRETRSQVFEPFFTTKDRQPLAGLGLSTVYGIARQSGGQVFCYSEPGWGTSFKIYLPAAAAAVRISDDVSASRSRSRPGGRPETVLVVDDEAGVRRLTCQILKEAGYAVLEAGDGIEALGLCERYAGPIDLVATDLVMPTMSGTEFTKRLAQTRPETQVLYLSGFTEASMSHNRVLDAGACFLSKPFAPEALAARVRALIDGSRHPSAVS